MAHQAQEPRKVNNLTLIDGKTFLATSVAGDIVPPGAPDVGFFHEDTRFLSHLEFRIDGQRSVVLSSSTEKTFVSQIELTTGNITLRDSFDLPENTIHIRREQLLASDILFDRYTFENFNRCPVEFTVEISFDADFVDVFQVRGVARADHGQYYQPVIESDGLIFSYRGRDNILRQTVVRMNPAPVEIRDAVARWELRLEPLGKTALEITVTPCVERQKSRATLYEYDAQLQARRAAFHEFDSASTSFSSSNSVFDNLLRNAMGDFHALRIPVGDEHVIAAGIPWFATLFGRDSIIAAYQTLSLNPELAKDTLRVLARYQASEVDDWRDAQPGKILHESQRGGDDAMRRDALRPLLRLRGRHAALACAAERDLQLDRRRSPGARDASACLSRAGLDRQLRRPGWRWICGVPAQIAARSHQPGLEGFLGRKHASRWHGRQPADRALRGAGLRL